MSGYQTMQACLRYGTRKAAVSARDLRGTRAPSLAGRLHQKAGLTIDAGRSLLWFLPFFTGLFSIYALGRAFYKTRTAGIVAAVYFMASNMTVWAAHVSWIQGIAGLSIAPLAVLFFIKASTARSALDIARHALFGGILLSIIVWYDMKVALMAYAFITGLAAFMLFAPDRERLQPGFYGLLDKARRPALILAVLGSASALASSPCSRTFVRRHQASLPKRASRRI